MVEEVNSSQDLGNWYTKDAMLSIRRFLKDKGWKLEWNARSSNRFVDALAKLTLSVGCNFFFNPENLFCIHANLTSILVADMADVYAFL